MSEQPPNISDRDPTVAFLELLGRHERSLRAFVLALVPHWNDADEIMQQTRIRLWEQFSQYDPAGDFGAWARAIARYQVLTLREKQGRDRLHLETDFVEAIASDFSTVAEELDDRRDAMRQCLEKLEEAKRQLLLRYYAGDLSMRQLAAELDQSFDSVRHTILRSRRQLARCVERQLRRESQP